MEVFPLFKLAYLNGVSWESLWGGYLVLIGFFIITAIFLWPSKTIEIVRSRQPIEENRRVLRASINSLECEELVHVGQVAIT